MSSWIENELKGCEFPDVRLGKRFKMIIEQLATGIGRSLPFACQDWANTKAAYRFLDNQRISEAEILKGHFQETYERFKKSSGTVLVLHDTTEFTFRRKHTEAIGKIHKTAVVNHKSGRPRLHTVCGILIQVCPPIGNHKRYPSLPLTVIHARERGKPQNRDPIDWKLITDLPVTTRYEAIEKINWYSMRWKIETFHKVMKSGCKAEESKLRTASRLTNLIAIFSIIAWRVFWLCMINRIAPHGTAKTVFTETEMELLDRLVPVKSKSNKKSIKKYLTLLAKLGGYMGRSHDPPPGNMVVWRGFRRLTDIHLGFSLANNCG